MSENYLGIIFWELLLGIMSGNYDLVYHHAEKLRFIGILAYPKISTCIICGDKMFDKMLISVTWWPAVQSSAPGWTSRGWRYVYHSSI